MIDTKRVLVIDRQDFWRQRCASALECEGYYVLQRATYDFAGCPPSEAADLIVLGCTSVGAAEVRLIGELHRCSEPVLLMCTLSEAQGVRAGFSAGADDVVERPYEAAAMVATVGRVLSDVPARHAAGAGSPRGISG